MNSHTHTVSAAAGNHPPNRATGIHDNSDGAAIIYHACWPPSADGKQPGGTGYVGLTTQPLQARIYQHRSEAKHGKGKCRKFHAVIRKHGMPEFRVVAQAPRMLSSAVERVFIRKLRTQHPRGCNLTDGGERGEYSTDTKTRMECAAINRWHDNPQYRANVAAGLKRHFATPAGREHQRRASQAAARKAAQRRETARQEAKRAL